MKKSLLTGRRGWFIAGTAAAILLGSAAVATASLTGNEGTPPGYSQTADGSQRDAREDADSALPTATEVSASEAADIALTTVPDGIVTSVDLEGRRSDTPVWSVDLVSPGYEHDVIVDATTGEIRSHERDDDDDWQEDSAKAAAAQITIAQAEEIALSEAADGVILEIELEGDDGQPVWQVEVFSPGDETWQYIKINAVDGSIISINDDYIGDDDDDWGDDDDDHESDHDDDDNGDDD
ncbi:putative membrane protein YkoI [Stackebrandtia endophytica]|uniref:Putative membrane protein YkoI n=1 Tax=Stackebrandtia endophytica TaxID=1496996 RepID=A0A543B2V3_9ACTN|nr:PepSY domain-containing protein [Stackebrandtia endophytica]TQL79100.1 putative membrane protein YkoI [Stackebrandtia endophytica]